jgi:thiol-disulfide isomerase/thioredoxin
LRARQKKRQQTRRLTIIITVVIIAVSIGVGIYFVSTANGSSQLDKYDGVPVSSSDVASLASVSAQPYGPGAPSTMQTDVDKYGGPQYISDGKPVVVYVGAEFCPYCAVERWALIMALDRFGNFTNLHYTTAANDEGDYATFTFVGSSYTSNYISFRPYEAEDRSGNALQTVPSNYSTVWTNFGSGFPFLNFENTYVVKVSLLAFPDILAGKNWTTILNEIATSDSVGLQIREAANLITGVICKVTQGSPAAVCSASGVASSTSTIAGPSQSGQSLASAPAQTLVQATSRPPSTRRVG